MQDQPPKLIRPTKKQRELLTFIEQFIAEHGYSPSYREIMGPLKYTSVATVALHVNNLIRRGHLRKRDHAARSLEVVNQVELKALPTNQVSADQEKWLVEKVDHMFKQVEQNAIASSSELDNLYVLVGAMKVLGMDGAVQSLISRLSALKKRQPGV